jgi:hypothetical protein
MKKKLPEVLKDAILTGDWNLVCKVYTSITGLNIAPPSIQPIQSIQQIQSEMLPTQPTPIRQKLVGRHHNNTFVDDFSQARQDLKSSRDMSKLYNDHLTERRPPSQLVNVRCGCGQIDQVLPKIASQYLVSAENGGSEYKCQRCIKK